MQKLFTLAHVEVSFNSTPVLKGISLDVDSGDFLGIIGPNGSGKSTLMRTMAGVLVPSAGSVKLEGIEVSRIPGGDMARKLAVVPQDSDIAFEFTVLEVVMMGRSPHLGRFRMEGKHDLDIVTEALERTNLLHLSDRRVCALSGGERQRVMIARALAQQPKILFLDEPTAHLDINYQVEVLHLLRRENSERGKTVVVVLHDLNLAAEFCDRLVMLHNGEIVASGSPDDVITSEKVQNVYGTAVWVRKHPTSGRPYILSMGSKGVAARFAQPEKPGERLKVHVICGGGSGAPVFIRLLEIGCEVTAGVINIGDTDQETAESLGIEYVEEAPFSPISEVAESANMEFIRNADAVVIAEAPFGVGNLSNLRNAAEALALGKRVAVIGTRESLAERDFADGKVISTIDMLLERGAVLLTSPDLVADWLAESGRV